MAAMGLGHSGSCGSRFGETHWLGLLWERVTAPTSSQPHFLLRSAGVAAQLTMSKSFFVRHRPAGEWWGNKARDRPTAAHHKFRLEFPTEHLPTTDGAPRCPEAEQPKPKPPS
jgi:hypothetical protein